MKGRLKFLDNARTPQLVKTCPCELILGRNCLSSQYVLIDYENGRIEIAVFDACEPPSSILPRVYAADRTRVSSYAFRYRQPNWGPEMAIILSFQI